MMRTYADYHTHTKGSDGRSTVAQNVLRAEEIGLKEIAITDHSFTTSILHMTTKKFWEQKDEIAQLQKATSVKLLHGIEGNVIDYDGNMDVPDDVIRNCDVLHMGFHRSVDGLFGKAYRMVMVNGFLPYGRREKERAINTEAYLKAMDKYPIDVLVHLNHRMLVDTATVVEKAAEKGVYIELNEKHIETLEEDFDVIMASGVRFILGSDAHKAQNVGRYDRVNEFIARHEIPLDRIFGIDEMPTFKDKRNFTSNYDENTVG